jgi:hypothetical protein
MVLALVLTTLPARAQSKHEITFFGTSFLLDGVPFPCTGISVFNADYNKTFNESASVTKPLGNNRGSRHA